MQDSPDTILAALLRVSSHPGLFFSELISVLNCITLHLRNRSFQEHLIQDVQVELLLGLILRTIWYPSGFDPSLDPNIHGSADTKFVDPLSKDEVEQLEHSMDSLFIIMLDISSLARFAINYPYESRLTSTLSSWLKSECLDLRLVACSMLSGLARAEEKWARSMVSGSHRIHHELIDMMASETNPQYVSIVYDFLLQLARPVENRESICQPAFLWVAAYRWSGNDGDVQYRVTTVLRYLVRDCPPAVRNLLLSAPTTIPHFIGIDDTEHGTNASDGSAEQRSNACMFKRQREVPGSTNQQDQGTNEEDGNTCSSTLEKKIARLHTPQDPPENPSETGQSDEIAKPVGTYFSGMLKLYMASDESMVKAEITRVVLEICRCFPFLDPSERASFVQHKDFATPLVHLIVGNGEPALRAQAYLAMVLMAREHSGRPTVQTIVERNDIFEQLVRDIAGEGADAIPEAIAAMPENTSVEQWNTVLRSVRENASWLVKDILEDPVSRILVALHNLMILLICYLTLAKSLSCNTDNVIRSPNSSSARRQSRVGSLRNAQPYKQHRVFRR